MTEPITRDTRFDELHLWFLGQPEQVRLIGTLHLVSAGKGVSLSYAPSWLAQGFPLSEDLPLTAQEHLPRHNGPLPHLDQAQALSGVIAKINAMSQCELFALTRDQAAQEVVRVIDVVAQWQTHFTDCGVSPRDIEQLADRIDGPELLAQRQDFSPRAHALPSTRPRRSPFR